MLNGDILTNLNPWQLVERLEEGALAVVDSVSLKSPFGILGLSEEYLKGFREKPHLSDYWINARGVLPQSEDY
jgi:NDP-sugar pyrophosphorylase family protein